MKLKTADLSDAYNDILQYAEPIFRDYGGRKTFGGRITTVKCHEDNVLVKTALSEPGDSRVLVVDAGGSLRRGMLGDNLAEMASKNGWSGIIMYGCIRDSEDIAKIDVGVKALGTMPLKSIKKGQGDRDIIVKFAGATFRPGDYLYADVDGIVVSPKELCLPPPKL
ncbi:predicted protein [Nematostella vectensis]|uniref:4-hydroxy-4-methyl-2-oxoglutarate aldolase n=2 Tax=Nematostella vectensis TaxID=45351 RepID=A7STJ3_NEMVE|nr:predicted protein [Nematostella vectensis]|eukprot:XP_001625068.1 predicted protein [Nematostella vectensis]